MAAVSYRQPRGLRCGVALLVMLAAVEAATFGQTEAQRLITDENPAGAPAYLGPNHTPRQQEAFGIEELNRVEQAAREQAAASTAPNSEISDVGDLGESVEEGAPALKWNYEDTNWAKFPQCRKGTMQSPVDLKRPFFGAFMKLKMRYKDQLRPIQENDGRVIKVGFKEGDGSTLGIGDKDFKPYEARFHAPSEHKLNGKQYDMEMQIMHKDTAGNQVGLSVFMQVSASIPKTNFYVQNFGHFFMDLPKLNNKRRVESMNLKWILNAEMLKHYVTYHGSLTSPPCTEGVEWFILGRPWLIEKKWLESFKKSVTTPNVRSVQPRGERLFKSF